MKIIRYIDSNLVMRPAKDHPTPPQWQELKQARREVQTVDGEVHCGTCWRTEGEYPFDLHHRHYNNFGNEHIEDVVLLCRACHEHITSRIREERFGLGDRSIGIVEEVAPPSTFRPDIRHATVSSTVTNVSQSPRYRPTIVSVEVTI